MLSSIKRVLLTLIILTVAAVLFIYFYSKGRTYYNDDSEVGNTTGNIYNGGLFCEQGGTIYFSNDAEGGKLYRMKSDCTGIKKVSDDKAVYINVDENYIYYARGNNTIEYSTDFYSFFSNTGIYRTTYNGKNLKVMSVDPAAFLMTSGNNLFMQRYNVKDGFNLTMIMIDGTKERILSDTSAVPIEYLNKYLYYTGDSKGTDIKGMELSSFTEHTYYNGSFVYPIFSGDYLYYINTEDHDYLYRINKDGTNPTLLVKKPISTYNITNKGKYVYYQINGTANDRLERIDTDNLKSEKVMDGNYKEISVTETNVFFKTLDSTTTYRIDADGAVNVDTFYTSIVPTPTPIGTP
jgi:hypothetical protein